MKSFKKHIVLGIFTIGLLISCKDDSLQVVPNWESAVHGYAEITSANKSFVNGDAAKVVDIDLLWNSIDSKLTVTKIEVYVLMNETYTDVEGNSKVAKHGGDRGLLYKSFEGSAVPANRESVAFTLNQANLYNVYKDKTFNYGNGTVSVFNNPGKPERNATTRFIPDDAIKVRWEFTVDDGRVFDHWGISVCTEFPGANCAIDFGVVCISNLAGTFSYVTTNIKCANCPGSYPGEAGCIAAAPITGNGTLAALGGGKYSVPDATFGQYDCAWDDSPAAGVTLNDVCDKISTGGSDQYGLVYTFAIAANNGTSLTINWSNDYGDSGTTVLTRTDGKTWPLGLHN